MPQERLSKIWEHLFTGSKVLGWSHQDQDGKHVLVPVNGRNAWERTAAGARWEEIRPI